MIDDPRPRRAGAGMFVAGFVVALVVVFLGGWLWLKWGKVPVAAADPAFPFEAQIVHVPLNARIARELQQPPTAVNDQILLTGAQVYKRECASCHGIPGQDVAYAKWMYPKAPQLWKKHGNSNVVGVSDDEAGETYWKVKNGIRLTGMPAYQHILDDGQMWSVSLLLKNADKPMPQAVTDALSGQALPMPAPADKH